MTPTFSSQVNDYNVHPNLQYLLPNWLTVSTLTNQRNDRSAKHKGENSPIAIYQLHTNITITSYPSLSCFSGAIKDHNVWRLLHGPTQLEHGVPAKPLDTFPETKSVEQAFRISTTKFLSGTVDLVIRLITQRRNSTVAFLVVHITLILSFKTMS